MPSFPFGAGSQTALHEVDLFSLRPLVSWTFPLAKWKPIDFSHILFSIGTNYCGMIPTSTQFSSDCVTATAKEYLPVVGSTSADLRMCHIPPPPTLVTEPPFVWKRSTKGFVVLSKLTDNERRG